MSHHRSSCLWLVVVLLAAAIGCDGPAEMDGGIDAGTDSGVDANVTICTAHSDCDDGTFCNGEERCEPGNPASGADGCVVGADPCGAGFTCDEASGRCRSTSCDVPDRDADGSEAAECGGDDCDDDDPNRYPGNPEVCDAEGHDEDCNTATVGSTDEDSDTYVSAACCNGASCGTDCDDARADVHPDVSEVCNGVDMDCDGMVDEGSPTPLCPGGLCVAGSCRADAWDRTTGGTGTDVVFDVALDVVGNVYLAGRFQNTVSFGGTPETAPSSGGGFLLSWAADGSYRWHEITTGIPTAITVDSAGHLVAVGSFFAAPGRAAPFVEAFDAVTGTSVWRETADVAGGAGAFTDIVLAGTNVVAGGHFSGSVNFGGGARTAPAGTPTPRSAVAVWFDAAGAYVRDAVIASESAVVDGVRVAANATTVVIAGQFQQGSIAIDGTSYASTGTGLVDDLFVVAYSAADASYQADLVVTGAGDADVNDLVVDATGSYLAGDFGGTIDFGAGGTETAPGGTFPARRGFVLGLSSTLTHVWHDVIASSGGFDSDVGALALDAGGLVAMGSFQGAFDFGGGGRGASDELTVFIARYSPAGAYRDDSVVRAADVPATPGATPTNGLTVRSLAIGTGDMMVYGGSFQGRVDFGSGLRTSAGLSDAFVVRVGM